MNELLAAAKAVIDRWDAHHVVVDGTLIADLRAAVERAEKPSDDFMKWWRDSYPINKFGIVPAFHGWQAGQQAERERIKDLLGQSSDWFENDQMAQANWLLEKIDEC